MKKYLWYGVTIILIFTAVIVTATILDSEHSSFNTSFEGNTTTTPTSKESTLPTPKPPRVTPPPSSTTKCFVGGCSGQLCTSEPGIVSTCEYRAEYACYQKATCEIQPSGVCGWTPTPKLDACLANPPDIM